MIFSKKGDFGIVIGYMFSFFVILSIFFATFYMYQDQLSTQEDYVRSIGEGELYNQLKSSFSLKDPYFSSGQAQFIIENDADINLLIKEEAYSCFDIFVNGNYISQEAYAITPKYSLSGDYSIIEPFSEGILSIPDISIGDNIKVISCNGKEEEFDITEETSFYFNEEFESRIQFIIEGSSFSDVYEYQINLELNSSVVDFSRMQENEIRLISPLSNFIELDLNFNSYTQNLEENSISSFTSTLGTTNGLEGVDPSEFRNGLLLSSLNFDGADLVQVDNFDGLENSEEFTLSLWVNQDSLSVGQVIFEHSEIATIELGNSITSNSNQIRFEVGGGLNRTSSDLLSASQWNHIVLRFVGGEVCLFFNTILDVCFNETSSSILGGSSSLNLGSSLQGKLDEVSIYSIALTNDEIEQLNKKELRYRELDFFVQEIDIVNEIAEFWVKMPHIPESRNISLQLYYDLDDQISSSSSSSIENTFTYSMPRTIGYLLDQTQSNSQGLMIMSLSDNNQISVGDDSISLNNKQSLNLASGVLDLADEIIANNLVQLTGNSAGGEMTVPVSWAGTEFYYSGFRNGGDTYCMLSPFGNANVDMRENGVIFNSLVVDDSGTCVVQNIGTANNLAIQSDIPILVAYTGSGTQDPFVFYPATTSPLFGAPSNTLYYAAGPLGANGFVQESTAVNNILSLGAYGDQNDGGNGNDGDVPAFKLTSDGPIGAIQQADGDGGDASTFVPLDEFSTLFGSNHDVSYISVVSNVNDANCSVFDSSDILVGNVAAGTGSNGLYKYDFGTGDDATYVAGPWSMSCDKPVWPSVDNNEFDDDEQNLLGYKQMRQYVYPEPKVYIQ